MFTTRAHPQITQVTRPRRPNAVASVAAATAAATGHVSGNRAVEAMAAEAVVVVLDSDEDDLPEADVDNSNKRLRRRW